MEVMLSFGGPTEIIFPWNWNVLPTWMIYEGINIIIACSILIILFLRIFTYVGNMDNIDVGIP